MDLFSDIFGGKTGGFSWSAGVVCVFVGCLALADNSLMSIVIRSGAFLCLNMVRIYKTV